MELNTGTLDTPYVEVPKVEEVEVPVEVTEPDEEEQVEVAEEEEAA